MERDSAPEIQYTKIGNFNSHAHVERDLAGSHGEILNFHFNSHAHVERDAKVHGNAMIFGNFNSHAHVERDLNQ